MSDNSNQLLQSIQRMRTAWGPTKEKPVAGVRLRSVGSPTNNEIASMIPLIDQRREIDSAKQSTIEPKSP